MFLSFFKYYCNLVCLKCVKVCMSWNKRNNHNDMHGATIKTRATSLPHPEWPYAIRYLYPRRCTYPGAWWPERLNCAWWCLFTARLLQLFLPREYVYLVIYTDQKGPDGSAVYVSLQSCGSSAESLFSPPLLRQEFGGDAWLFGKFVRSWLPYIIRPPHVYNLQKSGVSKFSKLRPGIEWCYLYHWKRSCILETTYLLH
jgi:hypothetical protein